VTSGAPYKVQLKNFGVAQPAATAFNVKVLIKFGAVPTNLGQSLKIWNDNTCADKQREGE
jgi:hypothetical protein